MVSKTVFGALGVVAALGIGGTAWATSGSTSSNSGGSNTTSAQSGSAPAGAKHKVRTLLERADHATVEVKVKGQWVTYDIDRGKVSAVSPTSITVARPDGQSVTEKIDSSTKYLGVSGESAIQTGKSAMVVSDQGTALRIRQAAGARSGGAGSGQSAGTASAAGGLAE